MLGFHYRISQPLTMNFLKPFTADISLYPGLWTRHLRKSAMWQKYLFPFLISYYDNPTPTLSTNLSSDQPNLFKSIHDLPTPPPISSTHDPLAPPLQSPTPPFNPEQFMYQPPPITTTCFK